MKKIIPICLFGLLVSLLVGCGPDLEKENQQLKAEISGLKAEKAELQSAIQKLQETDQYYYGKGIELLNKAADSVATYKEAAETFKQLVDKFPASQYVALARDNESKALKKADDLERILSAKKVIEEYTNNGDFAKATKELNKIKTIADSQTYGNLSNQIKEAKNRPVKTTINKLISEFGEIKENCNREVNCKAFLDIIAAGKWKRVEIVGAISSVYRDRKELRVDSSYKVYSSYNNRVRDIYYCEGSTIDVFYTKTNKETQNYFLNEVQHCRPHKIIGDVKKYSNSDIYIDAETITPL